MKRFSWQDMKKYWKIHSSHWAEINYEQDPEGLTNVCHPGAPFWLNQYYAQLQKKVYQMLFTNVPPSNSSARALDVGCGAGRWCRFLADRGYRTVGIDLQPELIEINRHRYPNIEFFCTSIQDYSAKEPFDIASSVTVLQHIPYEEQGTAIQKLRKLIKANGYAIVLENVHDKAPHVFSNTIKEWQAKFEDVGFHCVAIQRYDYNPLTRLYAWMIQSVFSIVHHSNDSALTPDTFSDSNYSTTGLDFFRKLNNACKRLTIRLDSLVEPIFVNSNIALPTIHCGFLFKAV